MGKRVEGFASERIGLRNLEHKFKIADGGRAGSCEFLCGASVASRILVPLGRELPVRTSFVQALIFSLIVQAHADGRDIRVSDLAELAGRSSHGHWVIGQGARHTYTLFLERSREVPKGLGWVRLEPDPQDGRAKLLRLTEAGIAVAERVLGSAFAAGPGLEPANDEAANDDAAAVEAAVPTVPGWSPPPTDESLRRRRTDEERRALHKVYTDVDVARECIDTLRRYAASRSVYVEPSAGDGAFLEASKAPIFGFDIAPEHPDVIAFDFLTGDIRTQIPNIDPAHLVVVGNPPFGTGGKLALEFLNRALSVAGLVGFIVPISFRRWPMQSRVMEGARLVHDSEIPPDSFTRGGRPYNVRCCFQVWSLRHPELRDHRLPSKPSNTHPDFEMVQSKSARAAKRVDGRWDFAVPRVGNVAYAPRPVTRGDFGQKDLFLFRSDDPAIIARLKRIDFAALSRRSYTTHSGFSMSDVVAEYEALVAVEVGRTPRVEPLLRDPKPPIDFDACNGAHLVRGDCLEALRKLLDGSVDVVIADPPYGVTRKDWDKRLPLQPLWAELRRVLKPTGTVVLTATQPYTSEVILSNLDWFKYTWVWEKSRPAAAVHAKRMPLRAHEDIVVFSGGAIPGEHRSKRSMTYNPQGLIELPRPKARLNKTVGDVIYHQRVGRAWQQTHTNYPRSVLRFDSERNIHHPTQKPVDLMRYLVRTYSNPGEVVLDFCMGSGTTGVAAREEGCRFIGIERDAKFFATARRRIDRAAIATAKQKPDPIGCAPGFDVEAMASPPTLDVEPMAIAPILEFGASPDIGPTPDAPALVVDRKGSTPTEFARQSWMEERRSLPRHLRINRHSFSRATAKWRLGINLSTERGGARGRRWRRKQRLPSEEGRGLD